MQFRNGFNSNFKVEDPEVGEGTSPISSPFYFQIAFATAKIPLQNSEKNPSVTHPFQSAPPKLRPLNRTQQRLNNLRRFSKMIRSFHTVVKLASSELKR